MKAYRHLFFDLDHTLWDFDLNSRLTWKQLFDQNMLADRLGTTFEPFFAAYNIHNDALWANFRNGTLPRGDLRWKRIFLTLQDFGVYDVALSHKLSDAYLELLPKQNALTPGALELLEHCKGKYIIHLITNGFEATQRQKLEHAGIGEYFQEIITSERCNSMKPHPDIFDYALEASGAACEDCLMIGDALDIDILGARNAGWDQVFYNPGSQQHTEQPTYEVKHWGELRALL